MENNNKIKQKPLTENGQIEYNSQNAKKKTFVKRTLYCSRIESTAKPTATLIKKLKN